MLTKSLQMRSMWIRPGDLFTILNIHKFTIAREIRGLKDSNLGLDMIHIVTLRSSFYNYSVEVGLIEILFIVHLLVVEQFS